MLNSGDKIKIKDNITISSYYRGKTGVIVENQSLGGLIYIRLDDNVLGSKYQWYKESQIELINE